MTPDCDPDAGKPHSINRCKHSASIFLRCISNAPSAEQLPRGRGAHGFAGSVVYVGGSHHTPHEEGE